MLSTVISLASFICCRAETSRLRKSPLLTGSLVAEAARALGVMEGTVNFEVVFTCSKLGNIPLRGGWLALAGASIGFVDENMLPFAKGVCANLEVG